MKSFIETNWIAVVALVLSIINTIHAIYRGRLDDSRLKVYAKFTPNNSFFVEAVNHGRRKIILKAIEGSFDAGEYISSLPHFTRINGNNAKEQITLEEKERHTITIEEIKLLFEGKHPKELFLVDSLGKKYTVKDSKKQLSLYYSAIQEAHTKLLTRWIK